ncbi:DNA-binding domain-containing protein [Teredinibacter turnerae]|uniref:HvfC/BufC N-terminal domain-containing protein n=1 Tax=Teredinibacter turnerae TaxID=2426 RepID=UPI0005F7AA20|nr:DNA-binding domain-containing protein [Teredinibacter turnerae]
MTLQEFQKQFTAQLLENNHAYGVESALSDYPREEFEARLAIYRNNVFRGLIDTLGSHFPATKNLVGDTYFDSIGKAYLEKNPPQSAASTAFGETFPEFINAFPPLETLPYLTDVARLDWAYHSAYHAREAVALEPTAFQLIHPDALGKAKFELHPSCRMVQSDYAVFNLWEFARDSVKKTLEDDIEQAQAALVLRPDAEVNVYHLTPGLTAFFDRLISGAALSQALTAGIDQSDEFNPSEAVAFFVNSRIVHRIDEPTHL